MPIVGRRCIIGRASATAVFATAAAATAAGRWLGVSFSPSGCEKRSVGGPAQADHAVQVLSPRATAADAVDAGNGGALSDVGGGG